MNNSGLPSDYVNDMEVDHDGNLWVATYNGLVEFNGDTTWFHHDTSTGLTENSLTFLRVDYNGYMWGGSYTGAYRYDNNSWTVFNTQNSLILGNQIIDIAPDNYGKLWISSGSLAKTGGVQSFDGNNTWATFTQLDGLVSNDIRDITVDVNDNIWFLSENSLDTGITKRSGTNWTTYQYADTVPLIYINKIQSDLNGYIWIISDLVNGVIQFNGTTTNIYNELNSPIIGYVNCIEVDNNGNIWLGTPNGALKFDGTSWQTFDMTNSGLPDNNVMDIETDMHGNVWFATYYGIAKMSVKASLEVNVLFNGSIIDFNDVSLQLYSPTYLSVTGADSLIAESENFVQLNFLFENLEPGNYYLKAVVKPGSTFSNMINSYYILNDTTFMWQNATIISLIECDFQSIVLNMASFPISITPGIGTFSGNISYDNGGTKAAGEPVPGAEVYIEQEPNDQPVVTQKTDTLGNFIFPGIPTGNTFTIYVDIPGLPMIETYTNLEITSTETIIDNLDFLVDTTGIYIANNSLVIEIDDKFKLDIYPNPFSEIFVIEYSLAYDSDVNIRLIDENGKSLETILNEYSKAGNYSYQYSPSNLSSGIYYLRIKVDNKLYLKKLILSK